LAGCQGASASSILNWVSTDTRKARKVTLITTPKIGGLQILCCCADGIAKAAFELEQIGRTGNLADGQKIIDDIKDELSCLEDYVRISD